MKSMHKLKTSLTELLYSIIKHPNMECALNNKIPQEKIMTSFLTSFSGTPTISEVNKENLTPNFATGKADFDFIEGKPTISSITNKILSGWGSYSSKDTFVIQTKGGQSKSGTKVNLEVASDKIQGSMTTWVATTGKASITATFSKDTNSQALANDLTSILKGALSPNAQIKIEQREAGSMAIEFSFA
ncbi:hypothetical protein AB751O23_AI_00150 [Chlamydiales bacterium SCGC AB-751-O23]|jgi:hypothetical protein|nr:hypothetical protein AB751O23_AI_00150 [Chlamydiales bacterium SCGC AB-751-O23]